MPLLILTVLSPVFQSLHLAARQMQGLNRIDDQLALQYCLQANEHNVLLSARAYVQVLLQSLF